jgi:hypothetical protein
MFRELRNHGGGSVTIDADKRTVEYTPPAQAE